MAWPSCVRISFVMVLTRLKVSLSDFRLSTHPKSPTTLSDVILRTHVVDSKPIVRYLHRLNAGRRHDRYRPETPKPSSYLGLQ